MSPVPVQNQQPSQPSSSAMASDSKSRSRSSSPSKKQQTSSIPAEMERYFRVDLGEVTHNNIKQLKVLVNERFLKTCKADLVENEVFEKVLKDEEVLEHFVKLGYFNDVCVAGILCTQDTIPSNGDAESEKKILRILGFGVLKPYREYGMGSKLLQDIITSAKNLSSNTTTTNTATSSKYSEIHVKIPSTPESEKAVKLVTKLGFEKRETIKGAFQNGSVDGVVFVKVL